MIRAIRERFPGDAILAEESGSHDGRTGRRPASAHGRRDRQHRRPGVGDRPARRHRQLRQRPAGVLRVDRVRRRRPAGRRRGPRPDPGRDVRRDRRRAGDAQRPADPGLDQGPAHRLRDLARARRPLGLEPGAGDPEGRPRRRDRWARPRSASPTSATGGSTRSSRRAACRPWDIAAAGLDRGAGRRHRHRVRRVAPGTTRRDRRGPPGSSRRRRRSRRGSSRSRPVARRRRPRR